MSLVDVLLQLLLGVSCESGTLFVNFHLYIIKYCGKLSSYIVDKVALIRLLDILFQLSFLLLKKKIINRKDKFREIKLEKSYLAARPPLVTSEAKAYTPYIM